MCFYVLSGLCPCRRSEEIAGQGAERTIHRGISGAAGGLYYSPSDCGSFSTENSLEADNIEIAESLYVHFAGKLGSVSGEEDAPGFVTYTIDDRTAVTLKEHTAVVINGTTGLRTWQASKLLSEWCLENRHLLRSKRIVELGCGVGLTGMVVCKTCCPLSYTFTDGHEAVLQSVEENLRRNSVTECHTSVKMLRWGDHESFKEHCAADVILGADEALLQYEPCTAPREKIFFYDRSCPVEIDKVTACPR
ncbi:hypothetical protein HPB49_012411 [Dermacentor silvarum]|uniref:Uncharacterized protein n=1 Tax=Dermacentor silvarum TaxID=543639 RepID=A0ACB8CRD7_DERSI|nr:hypothetical protein HPB49_012411 [Dermacentor silvarum]